MLFVMALTTYGQSPKRGDFIFPIRPNQENYLSGTMGELRATHFHSGIDIKTSGITGLPVYASAAGYVQRVRVSTSGYGNAIYVVHPHNNTVTVYAHLKYFSPEVDAYVRENQYKNESFEVNLFPSKNSFMFEQGDIIGKSGNSGSSSGPHLHFEIRDKDHQVLNPLDFGFDEIEDTVAPTISKIAFVTMSEEARINGMFGRYEFDVRLNEKGIPYIGAPLNLFGDIGVEIYTFDKFNGARNKNGVPKQIVTLDNELVFKQDINTMRFDLQRNILVHTNYKRSVQGGHRFNKLYIDAGNELTEYYEANTLDGIMRFKDFNMHHLDIRLEDSYGNVSQYNFAINDTNDQASVKAFQAKQHNRKSNKTIIGDLLELRVDLKENAYCQANFYIDEVKMPLQMAYDILDHSYYIYDFNLGLPDSVIICNDTLRFNYDEYVPAGVKTTLFDERLELTIPSKALFDDLILQYDYQVEKMQEYFDLNNLETPLRQNVTIKLKPSLTYNYDKANVYSVDKRGNYSYVGAKWSKDQFTFKTRELRKFTILEDSIPPKVQLISSKSGHVKYRISDKLSGIGSIKATVNDKWLLMHYDSKSKTIWSDEKEILKGEFVLEITDNAKNTTIKKRTY